MAHPIAFPLIASAPLANHLWQSTLFAAVVALVTLVLKNNRAQVRYSLWLAASLKFLIPFSLFVTIGSQLGPHKAHTAPVFASAIQQINEPFVAVNASRMTAAAAVSGRIPGTVLQQVLLAVWFAGFALALLVWWRRWQRIAAAMRGALPVNSGREVEAVRRLERRLGNKRPAAVIVSECNLEPGIVGIFRPALLIPASVAGRLDDAQLDAIILHELWHVRRRDNLAAAVHMLVQAVFWFHPFVWWIGARLISERERACDEKVVAQGSEPQTYAEGILKVCEFYLESPLSCVAGVTGSNLKKRIEEIMLHRIANQLNFAKKTLLVAVGSAVIAAPVAIGLMNPVASQAQSQPLPSSLLPPAIAANFETTTFTKDAVFTPTQFKDDKIANALLLLNGCLYIRNVQLKGLIAYAYGVPDVQISGEPAWSNSQGYDLSLKLADPPNKTPVREAVQKLLAEQFKLVVHREIKDAAVYDLVVADGGLKLTGEHSKGANWTPKAIFNPPGHLTATDLDMAGLLSYLNRFTHRVGADKTGLKGAYTFTLDWRSDAGHPDSDALVAALKDQLGLELRPNSAPTSMLVVDHAEQVGSN
ncbi:MAG TPA: M56 family metallopeptidase [Candidatus Angelobacter sp.]|nr:M56 family metallopeptidase [Candidatus Angelobacter sp.]